MVAAPSTATIDPGPGTADPLPPQELPGVIVFAGQNRDTDGYDLYRIEPDGSDQQQVTDAAGDEVEPAGSRDGRFLAYAAGRPDERHLSRLSLESGETLQLTFGPGTQTDPAWSPDGTALAYSQGADGDRDIAVLPMDAAGAPSGAPWLLASSAADERRPSWSPDGTLLAFAVEQDDLTTIRVVRAADGQLVAELPADGLVDDSPRWTPDGDLLFTGRHGSDLDVLVMADPLRSPRVHRLTRDPLDDWAANSSLDGSAVVYQHGTRLGGDNLGGLFLMSMAGGPPIPLMLDRRAAARDPVWVPDGWQLDP
jgi:Tol biopolymer transport system component